MRGIEFHELGAKWTGDRADSEEAADIDLQLELQQRCGDSDFGFRIIGKVVADVGEANAAIAVTYDFTGDPPSQRTLLGFGNEVAVMAVFPFFRESIHSITSKVFGQPVLLPVLPRGAIGFDLDDATEKPANQG